MTTETITDIVATIQIDGIEPAGMLPSLVRVKDAISTPRRIEVSISRRRYGLQAQDLLRKGVQIDVTANGAAARRFEGVVLGVTEAWGKQGNVLLLTVGSPLELLAYSSDCRIFQEKTVPEIVEQVLLDAGFPAARIVKRLSGTYSKLASCTQYNETMLAFVSRLLEAEGISYWVEDGRGGLDLVLGDSPDAHRAAATATLPFAEDGGDVLGPWRIRSIAEREALRPQKVTLRDLDWQKPALDLESSSEKSSPGAREHYEYPAGYVTPAEGKARAKARIEAFASASSGVESEGVAPALAAGGTFTLENAPADALSIEWLVTAVTHTYDGELSPGHRWNTEALAIPKSVPFRPLLKTPRPRIRGPQTAFVTGPAGQEIHTDAHARVKLKYHWDRHSAFDDKSSAWVRVAQLAMSGSMAIPRIGWEVLVEFEHGDPDRPIVTGRVYNAMYLPPYALPAKKTVSTLLSYSSPGGAGHNEIRIDDLAGSEHIHMHAQKDMELTVANDRTSKVTTSRMSTVKVDETITVKGNRSREVQGLWDVTVAGNQTLAVEGARTKTVKKDEKVTVVGDRKLSVTGAHDVTSKANLTLATAGDVAANVTGSLTESADEGASLVVGDDMSLTCGGPKAETAKMGKTSTIEGKQSLTVGGALIDVSGKDLSLTVGGKRTSTIGAAWNVTSAADIAIASADALELTIGGALTMTGATGIAFKVGGSKVFVGAGGVTIESSKVKVTSDGPASLLAAVVGSK
ncbi:MAG: type VI secretion system tip protein VgrG [Labilithrix sp.]|nr:type VI secretion system tip protein VgrG [Labilithrix sp.]MCW5811485.1 type VI secretion system tip protein VgrG [Labilithrix sp.]